MKLAPSFSQLGQYFSSYDDASSMRVLNTCSLGSSDAAIVLEGRRILN